MNETRENLHFLCENMDRVIGKEVDDQGRQCDVVLEVAGGSITPQGLADIRYKRVLRPIPPRAPQIRVIQPKGLPSPENHTGEESGKS